MAGWYRYSVSDSCHRYSGNQALFDTCQFLPIILFLSFQQTRIHVLLRIFTDTASHSYLSHPVSHRSCKGNYLPVIHLPAHSPLCHSQHSGTSSACQLPLRISVNGQERSQKLPTITARSLHTRHDHFRHLLSSLVEFPVAFQ